MEIITWNELAAAIARFSPEQRAGKACVHLHRPVGQIEYIRALLDPRADKPADVAFDPNEDSPIMQIDL